MGTIFFDYDHDGFEDLFVSNGYIGSTNFLKTYLKDPNKLYKNNGDLSFADISVSEDMSDSLISRGLVTIDIDNDGDLDLIYSNIGTTTNSEGGIAVYENVRGNEKRWLKIELKGVETNSQGISAIVKVYAEQKKRMEEVSGGGSHASSRSSIAHFGLGNEDTLDSLKVIWPGGNEQAFYNVRTNQKFRYS